ncbi:MAG TPA: alpha/beta hydrolase [Candidatus Dormibacteraeota bacterium]|nr:alpha/beta hydrolase [Candidatus Dormibacteraeota bacterium]
MNLKNNQTAADYIVPLNINGMEGRLLHIPAPKGRKREILFVYGHHSSLERWWGMTQLLNKYAAVTMPDLPGFGGMESFYKIGKRATLDNLADYLATFIKWRYKRGRVTIAGMSFGFAIVTRMLQRYPELTKNVDMLVSISGFAHADDFTFSPLRRAFYKTTAAVFANRLPAIFFRYVCLHPFILRFAYRRTHNAKDKFQGVVGEELKQITDFEIKLWHNNDVRTYMRTTLEFLSLDNCQKSVDLPVYHVGVKADRYFNAQIVEQHMRIIFNDFHLLALINEGNHAPSILADEKAAAPYVPLKLRRLIAKNP